jgi:hypothetical protein
MWGNEELAEQLYQAFEGVVRKDSTDGEWGPMQGG